MLTCTRCGRESPPDVAFCAGCGASLEVADVGATAYLARAQRHLQASA